MAKNLKKAAGQGAAPAVRDTWDLGAMYASPSDPKLERDIRAAEAACAAFEREWRPQVAKLGQPAVLAKAMAAYEAMAEVTLAGKPMYYLSLSRAIATDDKVILAALGRGSERLTKAGNRLEFFSLAIGKIPEAARARVLAAPALARWRHLIGNIFRAAAHQLSEAEEKLSNLLARPGASMWEEFVEGRVSALTVKWKGKEIQAEEGLNKIAGLEKPEERRALRALVMAAMKTAAPAAEAELNAVYAWKKTQDELRGYARPEDATFQGYEIDNATVETLRREVERAYPLAHRFHAVKAKLLGLPKLAVSDLYANVPGAGKAEWKPDFAESVKTLRELIAPIGDGRYAEFLDRLVAEGRIDAHPRKGKNGGAFCASRHGLPTYLLLNHEPSPRSFSTLAHEFGHAVHAWVHRDQPVFYDDVTMMTAEVASTFFEAVAFEAILARTTDPAVRLRLLVQRAGDFVATVFRQVAAHGYESALHRRIRAEGYLSAEEMAKECNAALAPYLGPAVELGPDDGYAFVYWGHLRSHFYFTPYAFGELVAAALYREYRRAGDTAAFERFMAAGCSDRAEAIFAASGVDVTKAAFWKKGLAEFEKMVEEIEAAAEKVR